MCNMKKQFTATYTSQFPSLYFKGVCNRDSTYCNMATDQYPTVTHEMQNYMEWLPNNDVFKVDLAAAYKVMKARQPRITMDQCLSWYLHYGNLLFNELSYKQSSLEKRLKSVIDYKIIVLDATDDFMQNDFLKFSNTEWSWIDIGEMHFKSSDASDEDAYKKANQARVRFAKCHLTALAFVDQDDRCFFAMPLFDHKIADAPNSINYGIPSSIQHESVTMQQMNDILAHFDLLKREKEIYSSYLIYSPVFMTDPNHLDVLRSQDFYRAFARLVTAKDDPTANAIFAKLDSDLSFANLVEYAINDKLCTIRDYFKHNLIRYYDKQGLIKFKYRNHNKVLQERCDNFMKLNKYQHNGHFSLNDYLSVGAELNKTSPNAITTFECRAFVNADAQKSPLNKHDCQQLVKNQLSVETVTFKTNVKHDLPAPLMSDAGLNKILVQLHDNGGHCFYSIDGYLLDLTYDKHGWKGRKINYATFE